MITEFATRDEFAVGVSILQYTVPVGREPSRGVLANPIKPEVIGSQRPSPIGAKKVREVEMKFLLI